jgi:hypothetical protein
MQDMRLAHQILTKHTLLPECLNGKALQRLSHGALASRERAGPARAATHNWHRARAKQGPLLRTARRNSTVRTASSGLRRTAMARTVLARILWTCSRGNRAAWLALQCTTGEPVVENRMHAPRLPAGLALGHRLSGSRPAACALAVGMHERIMEGAETQQPVLAALGREPGAQCHCR